MLHHPPRTTHRAPRTGFTLIELLVVIAIIAILAAILFPVFAQARDSARQSTCLNHMKQLGTALMMYAQDHDETLPSWPFQAKAGGLFNDPRFQVWGYSVWVDATMPYVKNRGVFACPNGPTATRSTWPITNMSRTGTMGLQTWPSSPGRATDRRTCR
jgi:prepilin-type N-terminal cleavage/methylation domain-containing protein